MSDAPKPLVPAFDAVHDQIDDALARKLELVHALAEAEQRLTRLRRSADQMLELLGMPERLHRRYRLDKSRRDEHRALGWRESPNRTCAIVTTMLARHPYGIVKNQEVQRHLSDYGVPITAKKVATILHRRCKQGMLTRRYRGTYQINKTHPALRDR